MANSGDLSVGMFLRHNGELVQLIEYQHRTPGNLRAFYQAKMRNVRTGKLAEYRFRSGEDVTIVRVDEKEMQYLYPENGSLVCMDNENYEQTNIPEELFGSGFKLMKEGMTVKVQFEGDLPIGAAPPNFVELEITYCEPGLRGDTATNTLKQATVETGATVMVPLFVENGEKIKIDARTGEYVERVK